MLKRLLPILLLLPLTGCFSERSFPMVEAQLVPLTTAEVSDRTSLNNRLSTRHWVDTVHAKLQHKLPWGEQQALTSTSLVPHTSLPLDVWTYFNISENGVDSIWHNLNGIEQSAQVTSPTPDSANPAPMWKGFHETSVPVGPGVDLYARLGVPEKSTEIPGSYIIITHGLFGSLEGVDMENHVQALRQMGHHVLAIEMRGHGQTCIRSKDSYVTFGITESGDLLRTAHWLKQTHRASRVGLVTFSLSGFESLLAAWQDGATLDPADWSRPVLQNSQFISAPSADNPPAPRDPAFNAGMFVVSIPADTFATAARFNKKWDLLEAPVKATFQQRVRERLQTFGDPESPTMEGFITAELRRGKWSQAYGGNAADLLKDFTWLTDFKSPDASWATGVQRLESVRHPLLVLSAANDPLATAQDVADLFSRVQNPNVGLILLKGGGHMGFSALSADYYYSLMRSFFNPQTAPRAVTPK